MSEQSKTNEGAIATADAFMAIFGMRRDGPPVPAPEKPWNWCQPCEQSVDIGDEVHDGGEVRCIGCGRAYVCVAFPGDEWMLCQPDANEEA